MFYGQAELAAPTRFTISPYAQTQISTFSECYRLLLDCHGTSQSFAAALGGSRSFHRMRGSFSGSRIKGDALCIRIGHEEYTKGLAECQNAPRGQLTLNKIS